MLNKKQIILLRQEDIKYSQLQVMLKMSCYGIKQAYLWQETKQMSMNKGRQPTSEHLPAHFWIIGNLITANLTSSLILKNNLHSHLNSFNEAQLEGFF